MTPAINAIPVLLSFLIGLLAGFLIAGFVPDRFRAGNANLARVQSDGLMWLLLFAAFAFGVLFAYAASTLL